VRTRIVAMKEEAEPEAMARPEEVAVAMLRMLGVGTRIGPVTMWPGRFPD